MVIQKTETRNFNAVSAVMVDGKETPVMNMYASYATGDTLNFNSTVRNMDLYFENQAVVDQDFDDWKEEVVNEVKGDTND